MDEKRKVMWTAVQHGSGLMALLGLFLAISAYTTQPDSSLVSVGWVVAAMGALGFLWGRTMRRSR